MNKPNITWYITDNTDLISNTGDGYYLGSYSTQGDILINAQVWNNKFGSEDVKDISDAKLIISFENYEDSVLLDICEVSINNAGYEAIEKDELGRGICLLGTISGAANTGSESNTSNYKNIIIKFKDLPNNLKEGLKSLYLDISYD